MRRRSRDGRSVSTAIQRSPRRRIRWCTAASLHQRESGTPARGTLVGGWAGLAPPRRSVMARKRSPRQAISTVG